MAKAKIQKKYLVTKQNALNEFHPKGMTLQEFRFFTIYLSKINPKDSTTRAVRFPVDDFQAIMGFGRVDIKKLKQVVDGLLMKITGETLPSGGFLRFALFKRCYVDKDDETGWFVEFDASDDALPLMFDFKRHYFKYELWNTLRLKSLNQLRMYEILKQFEHVGYRILSVDELKDLLGIDKTEYPRFGDFRNRVLDACQKALSDCTDISYTYESHGKKGRGGKVFELKFTIIRNENYIDPLSLGEFIQSHIDDAAEGEHELNTNTEIDLDDRDENGIVRSTGRHWMYEERISFLMDACNNEFSREEVVVLYGAMAQAVPQVHSDETKSHDYLQQKYREMNMRQPSRSRFGYLKKLVTEGAK